jgi:hypothetical protein
MPIAIGVVNKALALVDLEQLRDIGYYIAILRLCARIQRQIFIFIKEER